MKPIFKRLPAWIVPPLVLAGLAVLGHLARPEKSTPPGPAEPGEMERCLARLRQRIRDECVVQPLEGALFDGALAGMLHAIPYADFFPVAEKFQDAVEGERSGIGVCFLREGRTLRVARLLEGSPAAGLVAPGDEILRIDGRDASALSLPEAWNAAFGPEGTPCRLQVRRASDGACLACSIPRKKIRVPSVPGACFLGRAPRGTGYIRVSVFHAGTAREFGHALERLQGHGLRALVIDLRANPGGLLEEAVRTANFFVPQGLLLEVKGRRPESRQRYTAARADCRLAGFPCAVVVNEHTASAAEALAGILRDRADAVLVGTRTLGKGAVQTAFEEHLGPRRFVVRIPTALFYLPSGRCLDRYYGNRGRGGLAPDRVALLPRQRAKAIENVLDLRALAWDRDTPVLELPAVSMDPQLHAAVEVLAARLARKTGEKP